MKFEVVLAITFNAALGVDLGFASFGGFGTGMGGGLAGGFGGSFFTGFGGFGGGSAFSSRY